MKKSAGNNSGRGGGEIILKDVTIGYAYPIVTSIDLTVKSGQYWGIIGPNGAGKTTLFKTILGLIPPLGGRVERNLPPPGRIAYVPQQTTLKASLPVSVEEFIMMPARSWLPFTGASREAVERFNNYTAKLGIKHLIKKQVSEISGGERQKSLICRALMMNSPVLLFDEPTNGMDIASEKEILDLIRKLNKQEGYTIIFVTHFLANLLNEAEHFAIFAGKSINIVPHEVLIKEKILQKLYKRTINIDCVERNFSLRIGAKL
ncbi:MAG: hypothetical protein A2008_03610 [Candidatus Wallbacteria bacterium GWC2_49_35]|uniref:ABC transporter domain-containing protein n=1 Tax=Candidatus Wallbacteria bacterium GWC2_49_35 TaxID=1817813 RepID=A0A1F7X233_9BACT|nr:MAG: hypothetical protein A2008_03610 [Candidatus Wallbacteria bacterium GWC2_49_35]HBC74283.1 manganese ABC transporter ATP-binding protein [Candidatus Wallbacteria bacterium]